MSKQILIDAKLRNENGGQKQSCLGEVLQGGEGPNWTLVPSKIIYIYTHTHTYIYIYIYIST